MDIQNAISVRQLNLFVKSLLEGESKLADVFVRGEISNFKNHYQSGHWYFTLKDSDAAIRTVMFKFSAQKVSFTPCDGMSVIVRGRVSVYEKDGQYQLYAEQMVEDGVGDLALKFALTKEKLLKEGLFDEESKRPLCKMPEKIAVVTSDTGAAVRDIINIMGERFPLCTIILCPVLVQGENAAADIISTLDRVYALDGIDGIIIGRGGGSAEDLAAFNDEALARKIYESPFPIVSAVGHETDFSISDFVADLRASTPSHAAVAVTPDGREMLSAFCDFEKALKRTLLDKFDLLSLRYKNVINSPVFKNPLSIVAMRETEFDAKCERFRNSAIGKLTLTEGKLSTLMARIDALSPLKTLARGFTYATVDGSGIKSVTALKTGDTVDLRFYDGAANCTVNAVKRKDTYNGK